MEILSRQSDSDAPVGRMDELDAMLANASRMFQPMALRETPSEAPQAWSPADGWNLKLGQSAQNVLRHQLSNAPADVVGSLRGELSDDYARSQQQQVPLNPVVESLVRAALGDEGEAALESPGPASAAGSLGGFNGNAGFEGGSQATSGSSLTPGPADMQGWGQGAEGNCAAVATIKAATDAYGDQLFQSMTQLPDGGYRITMQDGVTVEVSGQELGMAAQSANFTGKVPEQAMIAYAAMAKRALLEGHEGATNYSQALNSLANGDNPYDSARFLGLSDRLVNVDPRTVSGQDSVVAWNATHAVFVDNRSTTDSYGSGRAFDGTDTRGRALTSAFTFKPASAGVPTATRNVYHRHFNQHMSNGKRET